MPCCSGVLRGNSAAVAALAREAPQRKKGECSNQKGSGDSDHGVHRWSTGAGSSVRIRAMAAAPSAKAGSHPSIMAGIGMPSGRP